MISRPPSPAHPPQVVLCCTRAASLHPVKDDVQQLKPLDSAIAEEWARKTGEPDLRAVSASKLRQGPWWSVGVAVMELIRTDPLESELRDGIAAALTAVPGVTGVEEEDREVWSVTGDASGKALVEAVAQVVDDFADRTRDALRRA